jgi:serine/threonine-protein kinase
VTFAAVIGVCSVAGLARAQDAKTTAEALFQEARQLLEAGRWEEACPKLAASLRLDPSANGTRLNLARCWTKTGKVASAWTTAREALAEARRAADTKRATAAQDLLAEVEPLLPKLAVKVTPSRAPTGLVVFRDGVRIDPAAWGLAVPVDPGDHVVSAEAPGKTTWSARVHTEPRQLSEIEVPSLRDAPVSSGPPPSPEKPTEPAPSSSSQRIFGVTLGGVGIVGLGLGTFFGLRASSTWGESQRTCVDLTCDPAGHRLAEDASSQATISTVAFAAGAALLVGGILLWLTAPSTPSKVRVAR